MMMPLFHLLVIAMMTLPPSINAIVPPKTPVLSGFEPAAVGSYRELVCDASQPGAGAITYKWYKYSIDKNGVEDWESKEPISTSQKYVFRTVTEDKKFYLNSMFAEPVSGKYKCRASNSAETRNSEWGDLNVYKPCSLYTVSVSPTKPAIGETFTLNCHIPNPSGFAVNWMKKADTSSTLIDAAAANSKGCHAPDNPRYSWSSCSPPSISSKTKTFNLQVTNAQPADSAYWVCKDIGLSCDSNPVTTVVQAPPGTPQITGFPSGPMSAGDVVNLKCVASPSGDTYDWYKDGTKVSTSLTYDFYVAKESAGVYICEARNAAGSANSTDKKTLKVYYKADSVVVSSGKTSSPVGEKDKFTCTVSGGSPTPNVKLYIKRSGGTPVEVSQGQDRVMAKEDNQAEYYCEAKVTGHPKLDMTSSRKNYTVTFPPNGIQLSETSITAKEGVTKTISCSTTSSSNPAVSGVSVKKRLGSSDGDVTSGTPIVTNGAYHGKDVSIDIKLDTNRTDNGAQYICSFTYASTTFTKTATVNVHWLATELKMVEKPSVAITAGDGVTIKCETDSSNPGSPISWYRNGQQITNGVTPSRTLALDGGTIYISVLTFIARKQDNKEKYECKINDQANFKEEVTIKVNFSNTKVSFLHNPTDAVQAGLVKKFTCETDESNPITSIQWHQYIGSSWRDITAGISSSERNGVYGGKIRISEWAVTANKTMNKVALRCKSTYPLTGHVFTTIANTTMNVIFNASKITILQHPLTAVHEGKPFTIVCETDSANPVADIQFHRKRAGGTWEQLTTGVTPEDRPAEYNGKIRKSTLTVTADRRDNQAVFKCEVKEGSFHVEQTVMVNISWSASELKMAKKPSAPTAAGTNISIRCETNSSNSGSPETISWYRNEQQITTGVSNSTRQASDKGTIYISELNFTARKEDNQAKYECKIDKASFKKDVTITVHFPPNGIQLSETSITVKEGVTKTITCNTTSSSNPAVSGISVKKKKPGSSEVDVTGLISRVTNGEYYGKDFSIDIKLDTNRKDNGAEYICSFTYVSTTFKKTATINVQFPPNVSISSNPKPVKEGDSLTLTCAASGGNPTSYNYKWFYKNKEIPNGTSKDYKITSINYTQSGTYTCQATNSPDGKTNASMNIDIQYKARWNPELPELPEVFTAASKLNTSMKFVLHVIANPSPTKVTWFFSNTATLGEAFNATKVNETMYTLSKQSVGVNDYGNYTVNVTNAVGVSTFTFELKKAGPPDTPCCLALVNATAVSITLNFTSGFAGGSAQTFTIKKRTSGGNVWDIAVKGIADPGIGNNVTQKISELDSYTDYEFRVKATNADVDSGYGEVLKAKTGAAPNATLIVERDGKQVTVSWPKLLKEYTKIRIKYCQKGASCDYHDVPDPTSLKSSFTVKEGNTYTYSMIIYDGEDLVFTSAPMIAPSPGPPAGPIAGGVGGFLIIIAVVLALVFVMKRRRAEKDAEILNTANNNGDANGGQVNPGFSDLDAGHSDVTDGFNPYEDSVEMTSPSSSIQIEATAVAGGAEYAVVNKKGSKKPPIGDAYAEVDLKKKKGGKKGSAPPQPGGQAYAEVDFSKKSKGKGKGKAPVPSAGPGGQAYAEVDFTKKAKKGEVPASSAGPGDVYAEVSKPKKPSKPPKPGKPGSDDQAVYANVPNGDADEENLYEDVRKEEPIENGYRQPKEAYQVGVDGTIYSQLQISPPKNPDVIRGMDTIEEYASVDFSLQAPPLPEPEDPDDPNDPGFLVLL